MSNEKFPLICVVGPTASGKTGLAAALAQRLDGEVVSADSMQIYQGMSIGTAKPAVEEMRGIPHHMIDFLSPKERFSVADYAAMARKAILDIHKRGRLPILAGGTGLYVQAVTEGILFQEEPENPEIRRRLERRAEEKRRSRICFGSCRRSIPPLGGGAEPAGTMKKQSAQSA
ncbi:MAG: tRNA (adenosine(37)-N6)-dimethylallyltransferase MiaA [[Clostridium] leptum]